MHVRCPHCHNPIEVLEDASLSDIPCPSCGSSFSLIKSDDTTSYRPNAEPIAHFVLKEKLGVGAFGTVWKAHDTQLDRNVAIKVPRKGQLDAEETEKFFREARAAAQLRHPNIVSVHEVGRDGDTVYIVSDLVDGLSLSDWVSGQQVTAREAARLCWKIGEALEHAHSQGVIHRDLKPSNIMLDANSEPHIMDFGLAKREAGEITMTMEGQILGTPAYMSPEQARGDSHQGDARSDIYSLGVILFQLLTGELPFRGNKRMLLHQVIREEPPSPRKFNAAIPRDLETICLKCLEKDPSRRFASAADLAAELLRYLEGKSILSRPVTRIERGWRWSKRNPVVATLSFAILSLLLFLSVAGPIVYFREAALRKNAEDAATAAEESRIGAEDSQKFAEQEADRAKTALTQEAAARKDAENAESQSQLDLEKAALHAKAASLARDTVVVSRDTIRNNLYFAQMNLAHQALLDNDIPQVDKYLNEHIPGEGETDLRGFEWYYLRHAGRKAKHQFPWKGVCLAVSPRGDLIATAGDLQTGKLNIHLLDTKNFLFQFKLPLGEAVHLTALAFSPDGGRLVSGHYGDDIICWSIDERKQLWKQQPYENKECAIREIAFSPDGTRIAIANGGTSGSDPEVLLLDAATGKELRRFPAGFGFVGSLAYVATDKLIAGAGFEQLFCWNPKSGESLWETSTNYNDNSHAGLDYYNMATSLSLAPDQSNVAAAFKDGSVRLLDITTGQQLVRRDDHRNEVTQIAFSPNGEYLASVSADASCKIRNATTLAPITSIPSIAHGFRDVGFSYDSEYLLTCSDSGLTVWDLDNALRDNLAANYQWGAQHLAVSRDGQLLAHYADNKNIRVHNIDDPQSFVEFPPPVGGREIQFVGSEESPVLAGMGDREIWAWDINKEQEVWKLVIADEKRGAYDFCVSDDTEWIATSQHNGAFTDPAIRIWETSSGEMLHEFTNVKTNAFGLAFSPDRSLLFSVHPGSPTMIHKWNLADGSRESFGEETGSGPNRKAVFSADSKLLAASMGTFIHILDPMTGEELVKCPGHSADVMSMVFLDNNRTLASGAIDNTVRLWDVATGQLKMTFRDHRAMVNSLAATPDGETLISASRDRTIRFRRAKRQNPLPSEIRLMKMSPDGKFVATAGFDDHVLRVWDRATRALLFETTPTKDTPQSICFSPDSSQIVMATSELGATIYDSVTGDQVQQLGLGTSGVQGLAFSPDGSQLVMAHYRKIERWDLTTGGVVAATAIDNAPNSGDVAVSPDGKYIVTGSHDGAIRIWNFDTLDVQTEVQIASSRFCLLQFVDAATVLCVSWDGTVSTINAMTGRKIAGGADGLLDLYHTDASADGSVVFVVCTNGDIIELQRSADMSYRETHRWPDVYSLQSVAVTPDGKELFTGVGDGRVTVWDTTTHRGIDRLAVVKDQAHFTLDVTTSGSVADSAKEPSYFRERPFFKFEEPELFEMTRHSRGMDVAISFDGSLIAAAVGNEVRVWRGETGERLHTFDKDVLRVCDVAFRPNSNQLASAGWDRVVRFWDMTDGVLDAEIPIANVTSQVSEVAFTSSGKSVAIACTGNPNRVEIWDVDTKRITGVVTTPNVYWWPRVAISPDDRFLLSFSMGRKRTLGVWSLPDLNVLYTSTWQGLNFCEFHPHEPYMITGGAESGSRRISLEDFQEYKDLPWGTLGGQAAFSHDGSLVAVWSRGDVATYKWPSMEKLVQRPRRHLMRVAGMKFTPDDKSLVTIGFEGFVKIWDASTGELIRRLE